MAREARCYSLPSRPIPLIVHQFRGARAAGGIREHEKQFRLRNGISLSIVNTDFAQQFQLRGVLDKFRDGLHAHQMRHFVDRLDHGAIDRIVHDIVNKSAVDLEIVDRQMLEIREGRMPLPKSSKENRQSRLLNSLMNFFARPENRTSLNDGICNPQALRAGRGCRRYFQ